MSVLVQCSEHRFKIGWRLVRFSEKGCFGVISIFLASSYLIRIPFVI